MIRIREATAPVCLPSCDRSSSSESLYSLLFAVRAFEQSILEMFDKGVLAGTTHTCLGQEECLGVG